MTDCKSAIIMVGLVTVQCGAVLLVSQWLGRKEAPAAGRREMVERQRAAEPFTR